MAKADEQKGAIPSVAQAAPASDAPVFASPPPPQVAIDYRDLALARARRGNRRKAAAIAICAAAAFCVVAGAAIVFSQGGEADVSAQMPAIQQHSQSAEEGDVAPTADASVVRDEVQASLDVLASDEHGSFMRFAEAFMAEYDRGVNTSASYTLSDIGLTVEEFSEALREGFSCEVTEVDVYGSTAWVNVSVASKSLADQADEFAEAVKAAPPDFADEEAYRAFLKGAYLDAFSRISPRSHDVLVTVEYSGAGWAVSDESIQYLLGNVWYTSA